MISKVRNFVWPILEKPTADEVGEMDRAEQTDLKLIQDAKWSEESNLALEEARRLAVTEDERRKTAESKASNLLLVATALIPLLTYLEAAILDAKVQTAPTWLTLPLLAVAVAYLSASGWWAFRAVSVDRYHCVYPVDLVNIWGKGKEVQRQLVIEMLSAIRRNQEMVNRKVSALKMTHEFLLRAAFSFSALVLLRVSFTLWLIIKTPILEMVRHLFCM